MRREFHMAIRMKTWGDPLTGLLHLQAGRARGPGAAQGGRPTFIGEGFL